MNRGTEGPGDLVKGAQQFFAGRRYVGIPLAAVSQMVYELRVNTEVSMLSRVWQI